MNKKDWRPSKFVRDKNGELVASRNPSEVSIGSRLMADLIARWYDANIREFSFGDLLDLGAGKAPLYGSYVGNVESATLADWENSLHKNKLLDVTCDITKKLPFKKNSFDTVIFSDVLEHVPNPQEVMREIGRVMKPGGVLLMNVPFMYHVHEAPYDYHRYTHFMLEKLSKGAGLEVVKIEPLGGGWAVLIDLLSKLLGGFSARIIQRIGPKIFRARLTQKTNFPIAYAMVCRKGA